MPLRRPRELPLPALVPRSEAAARRRARSGALHGVAFRLRPGDGQGPRAYLDRQPYFQTMPRLLVVETAIHWIDTFRFLMGEVDGGHRAAAPDESGDRRRGRRLHRLRVRGRRDRPVRRQPPERPRRGEPAPHDGRDVARRLAPACCASTATRGCGGSRTTATRPSTPTTAAPTTPSAAAPASALQRHVVAHLLHGAPLENTARDYLANLRVQEAVYARTPTDAASSSPASIRCSRTARSGDPAATHRTDHQGGDT